MIEIEDILTRTCELYGVTEGEVKSHRGGREVQLSRLVFVNIAKKYGWRHREIAEAINRSVGDISYCLSSKQKDSILYVRGYNSMLSKIAHDTE
ncbi:MAG: hypothetical protein LBH60_03395 [Prevotellaceae bacterium]|jgi:chromosomal replication initiation ATPase DnaA|nr:hypothetical protein [Prevotellaceae bacterium]